MLSFLTLRFAVVWGLLLLLFWILLLYVTKKKSWNGFFQLCNLPLSFLLAFSRPCWHLSSLSLILNTLKRNKRKKYLESVQLPVIFFFQLGQQLHAFTLAPTLFSFQAHTPPPPTSDPKSSDALEAGQGIVAGGLGADHSSVLHQLGNAEQVTHPLWTEEWWYLLWSFVYRLKESTQPVPGIQYVLNKYQR